MPARQRPNVKIITGAQTHKILFTESGSGSVKATGVQALVGGKVETFTPKKEVILAAGAFNTPKVRLSHVIIHLVRPIWGYLRMLQSAMGGYNEICEHC